MSSTPPATNSAKSPTRQDLADAIRNYLEEQDLPDNIHKAEQLNSLPPELLSGHPRRPLAFTDDRGDTYRYHLTPLHYSVISILMVELLERFSFYGINSTQTLYLTGAYNEEWNADLEAVQASSYVSVSTAIAYTFPLLGALIADRLLGDYWAIVTGACLFYIPGLLLIWATSIPQMLGYEFNHAALRWGLLCLWPIGTGIVKSVVNVFGARQFHPILQASQIESYYVRFYMCINIGALVGGVVVPVTAQSNVTIAYTIPVLMLTIGMTIFVANTHRYVRTRPRGNCGTKELDKKHAFVEESTSSGGPSIWSSAWTSLRISLLILPFNIAYAQMSTTFIVQGSVMQKVFGFIDAAMMNNCDSLSILGFGYLIGSVLYPSLAKRNIRIATTHKFALGSFLGALAIAWALYVDFLIHRAYERDGQKISVAWQAVSYTLIGVGEIFAVSSAYEVAFTASPANAKALASAINLFCVGGLSNFLCIGLYQAGARWFHNARGTSNISNIHDYSQASVYKYFAVLLCIASFGILMNLLPWVRNWVASVEEAAAVIKTPVATPQMRRPIKDKLDGEETALLKAQQHENYLKYGSGPILYKNASFRAGIFLKKDTSVPKAKKPSKYVKYADGMTLYRPQGTNPPVRGEGEAKSMRRMEEEIDFREENMNTL